MILLAGTWTFRGLVWLFAGDLETAETQLTRGVEIMQVFGDPFYLGSALYHLGRLALVKGDPARARILYEQALVQYGAIGNRYGIAESRTWYGDTLQLTGDQAAARTEYARALRGLHTIGHTPASHLALCGLAELASDAGDPARALTLASVAMTLAEMAGMRPMPPVQARLDQVKAGAVQALSAEQQAAAWAAGQTMPLEQVIAEALTGADEE